MSSLRHRLGFTLIELLIVVLVLGVAVSAALTSFFFTVRAERRASALADLDLDARKLTEAMRRDLWLTSRDRILLYPPGPGPYTAISFPIIHRDDEDAIITPDENGRIPWNAWVIYHFWSGNPPEVRRTIFRPAAELSEAERMQQLARVAEDGHARNALDGENATTRTLARNLIEWWLTVHGPRFDGYSETPGRRTASFGSVLLTPDEHQFMFRVVGRNTRSTGFKVGMDTLTVTPSAAALEAETLLPPMSQNGPSPYADYQPDGTWSGNYRLIWPADQVGNEITLRIENDRWEERNFRHTGALFENTMVVFDTARTPHEFVVQLVGNGRVWEAEWQTRHPGANPETSVLSDKAVRVLVRGTIWRMADGWRSPAPTSGQASGRTTTVWPPCASSGRSSPRPIRRRR